MKPEYMDTSLRKRQEAGGCGTSQCAEVLSQSNKVHHDVLAFTSLGDYRAKL